MRTRLKDARIQAGYTQRQLALILGVSQQTVSKYETETIAPSQFKTMREFERVLGVEAEALFPDIFA